MKLSYYYSPESIFKSHKNYSTIHADVLLSDNLLYGVDKSWAYILLQNLEDIDTWSNEKTYENFKKAFRSRDLTMIVENYENLFRFVKLVRSIKHKNKQMVNTMAKYKELVKAFKDDLVNYREELLEHNQITGIFPFVNEGIWQLTLIDFENKVNQQDVLISKICDTLVNRESFLAFDQCFEELFTNTPIDTDETAECDFIKIPLWDLPFFDELSFKQLKYTREDLKPHLLPFKLKLKELSDEIFLLPFIPENLLQLKQLYHDKIGNLAGSIQQSINESLYISHIINSKACNCGLKFCLGIASAETLINYYEKTKTVLPYVADEIKQQTARYIDLRSSYVFSWLEIFADNLDDPEEK